MSIFSEIGPAFRKRSMHNLSHEITQTQKIGQLALGTEPIEVLPGDRFSFYTDMVVRISPLLAPIMSQIDVTTHYWFVPNRLIWEDWEEFITGGKDNDPTQAPVHPTVTITNASVGSLADYLGYATGVSNPVTGSALPFRGYDLIYNTWYRDENLQTELPISFASGVDTTTSTTLQMRNWNKDLYTAGLPWPQRGPAVSIPVGSSSAPIKGTGAPVGLKNGLTTTATTPPEYSMYDRGSYTVGISSTANSSGIGITEDALRSGMIADLSSATATDIRTLRQAFQLQLWAEMSARAGYRYVENTLAHFGVRIPDSRIQLPEYLGGGKSPVVVSEVLQTSSTNSTSPQGNMAGHAFSAQRSHGFTKTFVEHGFIYMIVNVQPKTMYQQGMDKMWFRDTKESYFWPMFEHIGEEALYNKQIYTQGTSADDGVFAYVPRYQEYRTKLNKVRGQFKTTLNYWHTGRIFSSLPTLSSAFVTSDTMSRINADSLTDNVYLQMYHKIDALRPVGRRANPGFIDHKW